MVFESVPLKDNHVVSPTELVVTVRIKAQNRGATALHRKSLLL